MKEGIIHIKLTKIPALHSNYYKEAFDKNQLCNRGKSLQIIKAFLLSEAFGNQPSLIPLHTPIKLIFHLIHLFTQNNFLMRRQRSENPSMVSFKGKNLSSHSFSSLGILDCLVIELRFLNGGNHITEMQVFGRQPVRRQRMGSTRRDLITLVNI